MIVLYDTTMDLQSKVDKLLVLLADVEESINTDSSSPLDIDSGVGKKLVDRLYTVAELIEKRCNTIELSDEDEDETSHGGGGARAIKTEDVKVRIPTPPHPLVAPLVAPPTTFPPSAVIHNSLYRPQPQVLDEPAKKRRREAEAMVKKLERPKIHSCGVSYNGNEKEQEFSDTSKEKIKGALPALKTHRHLFHYMVWSTVERLECLHCRKCTNEFPS